MTRQYKEEEDYNVTAVANKYKELTGGFSRVRCNLSFEQIVNKIIQHHTEKLQKFGDYALVLCSFDGTEHGSNKTKLYHSVLKFICMQWKRQ